MDKTKEVIYIGGQYAYLCKSVIPVPSCCWFCAFALPAPQSPKGEAVQNA